MSTPDETPPAEMAAAHRCPVCGERATLHCAGCGRVFCADHVARGFSLGYAFVCVECMAAMDQALAGEGDS